MSQDALAAIKGSLCPNCNHSQCRQPLCAEVVGVWLRIKERGGVKRGYIGGRRRWEGGEKQQISSLPWWLPAIHRPGGDRPLRLPRTGFPIFFHPTHNEAYHLFSSVTLSHYVMIPNHPGIEGTYIIMFWQGYEWFEKASKLFWPPPLWLCTTPPLPPGEESSVSGAYFSFPPFLPSMYSTNTF